MLSIYENFDDLKKLLILKKNFTTELEKQNEKLNQLEMMYEEKYQIWKKNEENVHFENLKIQAQIKEQELKIQNLEINIEEKNQNLKIQEENFEKNKKDLASEFNLKSKMKNEKMAKQLQDNQKEKQGLILKLKELEKQHQLEMDNLQNKYWSNVQLDKKMMEQNYEENLRKKDVNIQELQEKLNLKNLELKEKNLELTNFKSTKTSNQSIQVSNENNEENSPTKINIKTTEEAINLEDYKDCDPIVIDLKAFWSKTSTNKITK